MKRRNSPGCSELSGNSDVALVLKTRNTIRLVDWRFSQCVFLQDLRVTFVTFVHIRVPCRELASSPKTGRLSRTDPEEELAEKTTWKQRAYHE